MATEPQVSFPTAADKTESEPERITAKEAWDTYAEQYSKSLDEGDDLNDNIIMPAIVRAFKAQAPSSGGLSVVDLGCGSGHFLRYLLSPESTLAEGLIATAIGIDISGRMLELAKAQPHADVEFVQMDVMDWESSFAAQKMGASADAVFAVMMLSELSDLGPIARFVSTIAKTTASFIVAVPHPYFNQPGVLRRATIDMFGEVHHNASMAISSYADNEPMLRRQGLCAAGSYLNCTAPGLVHHHRTISEITVPFINHGWVIAGIEEPTYGELIKSTDGQDLAERYGVHSWSWARWASVPPVMVIRFIRQV